MTRTLKAAIACRARGWSVIPLAAKGKHPIIRWLAYQHALASEAEIREWFAQWPDANIGVVTGAISKLVVLDVDPRHGGDESLSRLEKLNTPLPRTVEATTGGGGRHVYFLHPGGIVRNKVSLVPGVDLRGDGGLVVVPPSIHPSGRSYVWRESRHPDAIPLAMMPDWLNRFIRGTSASPGHPLSHWRRLVANGVKEGERNATIASLAGYLLWHDMDPQVVLDLLLCWNAERCQPPLAAEEVAATVESISRLHHRERS
jgi:hypothetical protein